MTRTQLGLLLSAWHKSPMCPTPDEARALVEAACLYDHWDIQVSLEPIVASFAGTPPAPSEAEEPKSK